MDPQHPPEISVVIPLFNEEGNVEPLHAELAASLAVPVGTRPAGSGPAPAP
jgi:hypothetical protein